MLDAVVQLLPDDGFWLDAGRFPEDGTWRSVCMAGAVRQVQRRGMQVFVMDPSQGEGPGRWQKYPARRGEE